MNEEFIIRKILKSKIKGVDNYKHNGSTWLIFTSEKKWVIELTLQGTLWYNYYFFKEIFDFVGLDVVENQDYITKWVEDTVINGVKSTQATPFETRKGVEDTIQNGVKKTRRNGDSMNTETEDAIQNGVKDTHLGGKDRKIGEIKDIIENGLIHTRVSKKVRHFSVEDTIQNGVKNTQPNLLMSELTIEETIQNGVKYTGDRQGNYNLVVEDTIKNGVKHTGKSLQIDYSCVIEDVIKEGVKHTEYGDWLDGDERFDDIIENGVKETTPGGYLGFNEIKGKKIHQFETAKQLYYVEDVIEYGIKKTEGAMLFDESKIDTVISDGIKETHDDVIPHTGRVEGVIKNGVKTTTYSLSSRLPNPVGNVIGNGVKECVPVHHTLYHPMDFSVEYRENHRIDDVASVLEKGIKEVQPLPAQDGNMDWGIYYHRQEAPTKPHTQYVDDVVRDGVKETNWRKVDNYPTYTDNVIERGEKC